MSPKRDGEFPFKFCRISLHLLLSTAAPCIPPYCWYHDEYESNEGDRFARNLTGLVKQSSHVCDTVIKGGKHAVM